MSKTKCDALGRRIKPKPEPSAWSAECPMEGCAYWSSGGTLEDAVTALMLHTRSHAFKIKRIKP